MLKIIGVPLPPDSQIEKNREIWERLLFPRLAPAEREYIDGFPPYGASLKRRAARSIARMALQAYGKLPLPESMRISTFSYSEEAVFCATSNAGTTPCAIDAEKPFPEDIRYSVISYLEFLFPSVRRFAPLNDVQLIRLWTFHECFVKLAGPDNLPAIGSSIDTLSLASNRGTGRLLGRPVSWRWFWLKSHLLCAVHYGEAPLSICVRWLHWRKLYRLYLNFVLAA